MGDVISIANLVVSSVTAGAATYLAYLALQNSAKPRIDIIWQRPSLGQLRPGHDDNFIFDVFNVGRWYSKPIARDIVIEFECDWYFSVARLLCGGVGGVLEAEDRSEGSASRLVLRSRPFTLYAGENAKFAIEVSWFDRVEGNGSIGVKALSSNGAEYFGDFRFEFVALES